MQTTSDPSRGLGYFSFWGEGWGEWPAEDGESGHSTGQKCWDRNARLEAQASPEPHRHQHLP